MRLFLDSGAFSADSQGTPIVLDDYMEYIKLHHDKLTVWANLDVIGDAEASWENQRIMEEEGIGGLPVYHIEDDIEYLYRCLDYDYFCLGGMAGGASMRQRMDFLDICFNIICDSEGRPTSKVHGFGMAAPQLLARYPFYSYDSSSWVSYGRFGIVVTPRLQNGKYVYNAPPLKVFVSMRSPKKREEGIHYLTMSKMEQDAFKQYLISKNVPLGESEIVDVIDYELKDNEKYINKEKTQIERILHVGACNSNELRDFLNCCFYNDLAKSMGEYEDQRFIRPRLKELF